MSISREDLALKYQTIRKSHWLPLVFFFGGFIFDSFMIERIDSLKQVLQLIAYTFVLSALIRLRILEEYGSWVCPEKWKKIWKYQDFAVQFLLGTLLNLYSLFYFKSASLGASLVFIVVIGSLIVANEFVKLEAQQVFLILTLYFICVASLWILLLPTFVGFIGAVPFLGALLTTGACTFLFFRLTAGKMDSVKRTSLEKKIMRTGGGVILFFLLSYYFQLIPPVPLAVQYAGIFHDLKKEKGEYVLLYDRPWWKFWENGDQTFLSRPGDKIVAFASVYAPKGFSDQLNIRWMMKTAHGWQKQDLIPITVAGGREEGFRGYTVKSNYQPGTYRVQVETTDEREVGRISFEVVPDDSSEARTFSEIRK